MRFVTKDKACDAMWPVMSCAETEVIEEESPHFSGGGGGRGKNRSRHSFENSRPETRFHFLIFFSQAKLMNLLKVDHGVHCRSLLRRHQHCRPYLPRSLILPRQDRQAEKHTLTAYFRTNNELDWDTRRKGTGRTIRGDRWRGFCFWSRLKHLKCLDCFKRRNAESGSRSRVSFLGTSGSTTTRCPLSWMRPLNIMF